MNKRIEKAMKGTGDYTPVEASQAVLDCLENWLQDMDEILPVKWATNWAAILAKGLKTPKSYFIVALRNGKFEYQRVNEENAQMLYAEYSADPKCQFVAMHEAVLVKEKDKTKP